MADTSIEWATKVWNPSTGCDKVSPGCGLPRFDGDATGGCYALDMAKRLKAMGQAKYQTDGDPRTSGPGFGVAVHPDSLDAPVSLRKPERIFVNSMSDLFHARVPVSFISRVFAVMARTPQHTYMVLTKRPDRMLAIAGDDLNGGYRLLEEAHDEADAQLLYEQWPLPNVHLGTSIELDRYCRRADDLRKTSAAVRFLSLEPLLGPLPSLSLDGIGMVICGGESGPRARPMHPDWPRAIRDQCVAARVPFFFKQWGTWSPLAPLHNGVFDWSGAHPMANDGTLYQPHDLVYPDGPRYGEAIRAGHDRAHLTNMYRVGKKTAGRELDGRTWDEFPAEPAAVTR